MREYLDKATDPQSALERAYPRWMVWQVTETCEWWAAVKANLTSREIGMGCESYRAAETPGELAALLDEEDEKAGVSRAPVRLVAWALDEDRLGSAYDDFALQPVRAVWRVTGDESTTSASCAVSLDDPWVVVAQAGDGWAYAVYPVRA